MAAIVHFQTSSADLAAPAGWSTPAGGRPGSRRPALRVLEGGRSPRSLARCYARRRLVALVLVVLVAVPALLGAVAVVGAAASALTASPTAAPVAAAGAGPVLVVQSGDTLTSIARRLQPTGDIEPLITRLAALHGPGPLLAGDRLPLGSLAGR